MLRLKDRQFAELDKDENDHSGLMSLNVIATTRIGVENKNRKGSLNVPRNVFDKVLVSDLRKLQ